MDSVNQGCEQASGYKTRLLLVLVCSSPIQSSLFLYLLTLLTFYNFLLHNPFLLLLMAPSSTPAARARRQEAHIRPRRQRAVELWPCADSADAVACQWREEGEGRQL